MAGVSAADSTAYWGYANSVGTLIVSLLAPLLGTLADYPHMKRRWLNCFTWTGIVVAVPINSVCPNEYRFFRW